MNKPVKDEAILLEVKSPDDWDMVTAVLISRRRARLTIVITLALIVVCVVLGNWLAVLGSVLSFILATENYVIGKGLWKLIRYRGE